MCHFNYVSSVTQGGELLSEVCQQQQWVFDVAWSPRDPSLLVATSFDQQVNLYSLLGGSKPETVTILHINYKYLFLFIFIIEKKNLHQNIIFGLVQLSFCKKIWYKKKIFFKLFYFHLYSSLGPRYYVALECSLRQIKRLQIRRVYYLVQKFL